MGHHRISDGAHFAMGYALGIGLLRIIPLKNHTVGVF